MGFKTGREQGQRRRCSTWRDGVRSRLAELRLKIKFFTQNESFFDKTSCLVNA